MSLNVLLLGPQGSGKGTQAKRIAAAYGLVHAATGDMLRAAVAAGTPVGLKAKPIMEAGELVPDAVVVELIRERLAEPDAAGGFILDGFPRNLPQAGALDALLAELGRPLSVVFEFELADDVCIERMLGRARDEGRADDTPEVMARRLEIYRRETAPLVAHYARSARVVPVDAAGPVDAVWGALEAVLASEAS